MAGLVRGASTVFLLRYNQDVRDARHKAGHDDFDENGARLDQTSYRPGSDPRLQDQIERRFGRAAEARQAALAGHFAKPGFAGLRAERQADLLIERAACRSWWKPRRRCARPD